MAAKVLIVKVTRKHIRKGITHDVGSCPVALAIKELEGVTHATVNYISADVSLNRKRSREFPLSRAAASFVRMFDDGGRVKPRTFRLKANR